MKYLSPEDILVLHALVIDETGGAHGVRDTRLLASLSQKPKARFGGRELYKGVFVKAAVLLEAIANYHVFVDGNKRTALATVARFLHLNSYKLTASHKDAEAEVLAVATKDMDVEALTAWLKKHTRRV